MRRRIAKFGSSSAHASIAPSLFFFFYRNPFTFVDGVLFNREDVLENLLATARSLSNKYIDHY